MTGAAPLDRVRELIAAKRLDAVLITSRENTRYLSGFTGSDSTLLVVGEGRGLFLFTDSRYTEQAGRESPEWQVIEYRRAVESVSKKICNLNLKKIGFESRYVSYNLYNRYVEALEGALLVPVERGLDLLRVPKLKPEISRVKKAVKIAEAAFIESLPSLKPGVKENEWAIGFECALRKNGSGLLPFEVIVASGERGAMPHARATSKIMKKGEMVTVDFGATSDGYACDTTVTVALGKPSKELENIYLTVLEAHDMAIDAAKPGMELKLLDAVARRHIEKKGYGKYFGHGLGHGVGLSVHEEPSVSPMSEGTLEKGAVITIEPGIYVPGLGGVRIEDMILITARGAERLTTIPKNLNVLS